MRGVELRYGLWAAALLLLALLPALAGFAGFTWEAAQMAGLIGAIVCIALCGAPIRPRESKPATLLTLATHTLLGWAALLAVALHIGALLLTDHTVIEYVKPTAPLHQLAGIGAGILLLALVLSAIGRARRKVWASHRGFQASHVILSCGLIALIAVHVIATRRYIGGWPQRSLWLAASIGAVLMLLRRRRHVKPDGKPDAVGSARSPRLVFGRHSAGVLAAIAGIAVALAVLSISSVTRAARQPVLVRHAMIPLDFPHAKHVPINCLECHHNYEEGDFSNTCVACHRSSRTDLKMGAEARFHGFCLDCHRHPDAKFERHGPVAGCTVCHQVAVDVR